MIIQVSHLVIYSFKLQIMVDRMKVLIQRQTSSQITGLNNILNKGRIDKVYLNLDEAF